MIRLRYPFSRPRRFESQVLDRCIALGIAESVVLSLGRTVVVDHDVSGVSVISQCQRDFTADPECQNHSSNDNARANKVVLRGFFSP